MSLRAWVLKTQARREAHAMFLQMQADSGNILVDGKTTSRWGADSQRPALAQGGAGVGTDAHQAHDR